MKIVHKKVVAIIDALFNEIKPCSSPVGVYVQNCSCYQQHHDVCHNKAHIENICIHEATFFYIIR
jgi:hypothetical protein